MKSSPTPHATELKPVTPKIAKAALEWKPLLEVMVADGLLTQTEIKKQWLHLIKQEGVHALSRIGEAGLKSSVGKPVSTEDVVRWLAHKLRIPYLKIDPIELDIARFGDLITARYAARHHILPIQMDEKFLTVAICEPFVTDVWEPELNRLFRRNIKLVLSNPVDIARYGVEFFSLSRSISNAVRDSTQTTGIQQFEQLVKLGTAVDVDANDQGIVQIVDWLWQYALDQRASDIHLEPRRDLGMVRFRIDGLLSSVYQLPLTVLNAIISRIKVLSRMDVVEKRRPQDGRIKIDRGGRGHVEMRIASMPTAFGEKLVSRIFDPDTVLKSMSDLGFSEIEARQWEMLSTRRQGILLVTGPTGSGKTTTLYSTLRRLANNTINVCTIEDPIEMICNEFNQSQIQPAVNFSFANGLRALMRQDPDVIMVGEIRDAETADSAIQAALTGHLVISTVHTNDSVATLARLLELGAQRYLINAALLGVLAQRLVRVLCVDCKEVDNDFDFELLNNLIKPWKLKPFTPYRAVGCIQCRNSGYRGRAGVYELLQMNDALRGFWEANEDTVKVRALAIELGLQPLRVSAAYKVCEGLTTVEEMVRETPPLSDSEIAAKHTALKRAPL